MKKIRVSQNSVGKRENSESRTSSVLKSVNVDDEVVQLPALRADRISNEVRSSFGPTSAVKGGLKKRNAP